MKTALLKNSKLSWAILLLVITGSCQKESLNSPEQAKAHNEMAAQNNSQIIAMTQDVMDVTAGAMATQGITGGRTSSYSRTAHDGNGGGGGMDCAPMISASFSIDRTHPDSIVITGSLAIDYGTGATCPDSTHMRKGRITDSFIFIKTPNDSVRFNLTETLTFQGFQKDSVMVDGTFIAHSSSSAMSTLDIQNAKLTYPDSSTVTFSGTLTSTFNSGTDWGSRDDSREVTGSINGTIRSGESFTTTIATPILINYSCSRHFPVSGTIDMTVGGTSSVVDFGNGACDKSYTITTGGVTTTYSLDHHLNADGEDDHDGDDDDHDSSDGDSTSSGSHEGHG